MRYSIILAALMLCACATAPTNDALRLVQTRNPADVSHCAFLAPVTGDALIHDQNKALRSAQAVALNAATKLGATHILWTDFAVVGSSTQVLGDAYKCL